MSRFPKVPGGGPKGKGSSIYWVRRANQDARYRGTSDAAVAKFNERFHRIADAYTSFGLHVGPVSMDEKQLGKLTFLMENYEQVRSAINLDIDAARQADLGRLATAAKKAISYIAKLKGYSIDAPSGKVFYVEGALFDFS